MDACFCAANYVFDIFSRSFKIGKILKLRFCLLWGSKSVIGFLRHFNAYYWQKISEKPKQNILIKYSQIDLFMAKKQCSSFLLNFTLKCDMMYFILIYYNDKKWHAIIWTRNIEADMITFISKYKNSCFIVYISDPVTKVICNNIWRWTRSSQSKQMNFCQQSV
jgi:hypothetical protein